MTGAVVCGMLTLGKAMGVLLMGADCYVYQV